MVFLDSVLTEHCLSPQKDALIVMQSTNTSKDGPGVTFNVVSDNVVGAAFVLLSKNAQGCYKDCTLPHNVSFIGHATHWSFIA